MLPHATRNARPVLLAAAIAVLAAGVPARRAASQSLTVMHSFAGGSTDGSQPVSAVIQATDGNFYGTTVAGGTSSLGTVFTMTPAGGVTILHVFAGGASDGAQPFGGVTQASDGNLYGTTYSGGAHNMGVVYRITTGGVITLLHSFAGGASDGGQTFGGVVQASDGNLYGLTYNGGVYNVGVIYRITTAGSLTVLYSFGSAAYDGANPEGGLVQASDGNLYGTTFYGGFNGLGTVFSATLAGAETVLHSFSGSGAGDGQYPESAPVQAVDGNLYGTTYVGGSSGFGAFYSITTAGVESAVYSFTSGGAVGFQPEYGVIQASDGNFYGVTRSGGASSLGTVYSITAAGTAAVLHAFAGQSAGDGDTPRARPIQAADGALYGTTEFGGAHGLGTIFTLTLGSAGPVISSISPSSMPACSPAFTLTVNGSGFVPGAAVLWNGGGLSTTFVSGAQLTAAVAAGQIPYPGTAGVSVVQSGTTSNAVTFTITNGVPVISSLSPASAPACGPAFTLTVNGSCFIGSSVVNWNGAPLATTFVSNTQLQAAVPAGFIAAPGMAAVTVITPAPGGGTSGSLSFAITNPLPVLKSFSPPTVDAGGPGFTLTVKGACFISGSTVHWGATPLTTTFVSASALKAAVPAGLITGPVAVPITVQTPSPGGGTSGSKYLLVVVTTVKVTGASVAQNADGSYTATVSLKNTGYNPANSTEITKSTLGAAHTITPLPASVGTIAAGATATVALNFPSAAGAPGNAVKLLVSGKFNGGKFARVLTVTLP